jgi:hypothetical protein
MSLFSFAFQEGWVIFDIARMQARAKNFRSGSILLFVAAGRSRHISVLWLRMNLRPFLGIEFGDQFLRRRKAVGPYQDRFDFCPVDLRRIEPQPYPAETANEVWDVKSIRGMVGQLLCDPTRGLAVNGKTSVPVMVIEVPAESLLAYFKAQVIAGRYSGRLGKAFNNCDNSRPPLGGDLPGHFEWRLVYNFFHCHSHPSLLSDLQWMMVLRRSILARPYYAMDGARAKKTESSCG